MYEKLKKLEVKYDAAVRGQTKMSIDGIRKLRDQIIKLKFDLGIN